MVTNADTAAAALSAIRNSITLYLFRLLWFFPQSFTQFTYVWAVK